MMAEMKVDVLDDDDDDENDDYNDCLKPSRLFELDKEQGETLQ